MREIKFRAWDKIANTMQEMEDLEGWELQNIINAYSETLMQFTGLKDKNGKEIYEGDIVKFLITYGVIAKEYLTGIVKFSDGMFILKTKNDGYFLIDRKDMEVIGNIYENKDLLSGGSE